MASIQWHPGFQAGLELRLRAYKDKLAYSHEHPLTKMPIVVDTLVIEKEENVIINEDVATMFLRHNIVEYKNPDDAMSIDEYYNLIAYMSRYKAGTGNTDEVKADQVTGTLMRQRYPEEMFKEIRRLGGSIERRFPGVYYIHGLVHMPTQVLVQSELDGPENAVLRILTKIANQDDIRTFVDESLTYTEQDDKDNADAVYQVSVSANQELYDRLKRSDPEVCTALRELMKEELEAEVKKGEEKGRTEGFLDALVSLVKDGLISKDEGAKRAGMSLDAFNAELSKA